MKRVLVAVVLVLAADTASAKDVAWGGPKAAGAPLARTASVTPWSGTPVPVVAKLQPVVGSVQRTGHFTTPLTHKSKYTNTVYNPISGQFGTAKFRR